MRFAKPHKHKLGKRKFRVRRRMLALVDLYTDANWCMRAWDRAHKLPVRLLSALCVSYYDIPF